MTRKKSNDVRSSMLRMIVNTKFSTIVWKCNQMVLLDSDMRLRVTQIWASVVNIIEKLFTAFVTMDDPNQTERDVSNGSNGPIIQQHVSLFSPASYNLPHFKFKHLPQSEVRNAWGSWIRWFETVMAASNITDGPSRKMQLLAMGGLELQSAFYGIPGCDEQDDPLQDPYMSMKDKLSQYFSPKHHDSFERFLFWSNPVTPNPLKNLLSESSRGLKSARLEWPQLRVDKLR